MFGSFFEGSRQDSILSICPRIRYLLISFNSTGKFNVDMSSRTSFNNSEFWVVTLIFLLTIHIATAESLERININYSLFSTRLTHLLSIIGSSFVAFYTPLYKLHVYGNSISCMFVSIHVVARLIRLPLGLGVLSYLFMLLLVLSGYAFRYGVLRPLKLFIKDIPHNNRYIHVSLTASFYIVYLFHLLKVTDFQ
jgi:hypothetical protein